MSMQSFTEAQKRSYCCEACGGGATGREQFSKRYRANVVHGEGEHGVWLEWECQDCGFTFESGLARDDDPAAPREEKP